MRSENAWLGMAIGWLWGQQSRSKDKGSQGVGEWKVRRKAPKKS